MLNVFINQHYWSNCISWYCGIIFKRSQKYPMAINSTNKDEVFVGRIRRDDSLENTFHVWCTSDNLLKGAALNAVQVLEQVMRLKGAN